MFNLTNLITTCVLATGVATTTPVNNATTNPNILQTENNTINDYELSFIQVNTSSQTYNGYFNQQYVEEETKTNYAINSNYINVQATKYETKAKYTINSNNCLGYANELVIENQESKNYFEEITRTLWVMQITPYNYNIDTECVIHLQSKIDTLIDQYNIETQLGQKYLHKQVYTTTENWASYLNQQIVRYQCNVIVNDIEDINNGFYYTKVGSIATPGNMGVSVNYYDYTEINLTPNKTNYIVIDYVLSVTAYEYDQFNDTTEEITENMIPMKTSLYDFYDATISGTNIIPSGTYEVIDIPGLMWQILTMPFAFVSQAFNLTLFPGTPYQLNISNLFLSMIAVTVFIWLISFFLKMKG